MLEEQASAGVLPLLSGCGETGFSVYTAAYRSRLREALTADFPALRSALGAQQFDAVCNAYISEHPSDHYSLDRYGRRLPGFIYTHQDVACPAALAELASFERLLNDAFKAVDAVTATREELACVNPRLWPHMTLEFHPSVHWLTCGWNTVARWQEAKADAAVPPPVRTPPRSWLVWRSNLTTQYRSLEEDEFAAILALHAGDAIQIVCRVLEQWNEEEDIPARTVQLLSRWLDEGIVSRLG